MGLKSVARQQLIKLFDRRYENKLKKYKLDYAAWLKELEREKDEKAREAEAVKPKALCFGEGSLAKNALTRMEAFFSQNPDVLLAYADEDIKAADGSFHTPWLKPDWSPDTYLCRDYLGSAVFVKKELYEKLTEEELKDEGLCHDRLVELAGGYKKGCRNIGHLKEICFHRQAAWALPGEGRPGRYADKEARTEEDLLGTDFGMADCEAFVSVIIPSKDNAAVLKKCLKTVQQTVKRIPYELLIVDNGSCEHARNSVEETVEAMNGGLTCDMPLKGVRYLYEPMEFNFSRMCNIGAKKAKGKLLLFLNDDIEAVEPGWMEELAGKAQRPWVGAVGIKLRYPDSDRIQHAGVTNIALGPAHKMQFLKDNKCYYDGRNRGVWDVLAVTGACLMVRGEVFNEAGGFSEEIRVAFNDVDICFTLYELGYHNVVINSRHLLHHESLSRGDDATEEKQRRLLGERDMLYERHPGLVARDPYYHPWLNCRRLDTRIVPAYEEGRLFEDTRGYSPAEDIEGARRDDCLNYAIEFYSAKRLQGYIVVLGSDNAHFAKKLLFQKKTSPETVYQMEFTEQYRSDLEENMPDQKNIALSGFRVSFSEPLPQGEYRIGVLAKDRISGLLLINWSNCTLVV